MPVLTWPSKDLDEPTPGRLILDSLIYPGGKGYPSKLVGGRLIFGDNLPVMAALLPARGRHDPMRPHFSNKYPARMGRMTLAALRAGPWRRVSGFMAEPGCH
jgi:hypothetical protein